MLYLDAAMPTALLVVVTVAMLSNKRSMEKDCGRLLRKKVQVKT